MPFPYNYTFNFRPYLGTDNPNPQLQYNTAYVQAPTSSDVNSQPPAISNQVQESYNKQRGALFGGTGQGGSADRNERTSGSFREIERNGGFNLPERNIGIRDVIGGIGGLFGTGGSLIGNLAGAAVNPTGYFDTKTINVPGYGNVATDPGVLGAFMSVIPGASMAARVFTDGAYRNINDILSGKTDGVVGNFGEGGLASYHEGPFGLNGNFGTGATARANQKAIAKAHYEKKNAQQAADNLSRDIASKRVIEDRLERASRGGGGSRESRAREADRASESRDRTADARNR